MSNPSWFIRSIVAAVFAAIGLAACGGGSETVDVTLGASTSGMVDKQSQGCDSGCYGTLTAGSL